jgi:hypothetical protein
VSALLRFSLVVPLRIASFSLEADPLYPEGHGGKRGNARSPAKVA